MDTAIALEDLPDDITKFEGQLRSLRFEPEMEREYRQCIAENSSQAAIIFISVITFIWCLFAIFDIVRIRQLPAEQFDQLVIVWLAARWIALAFLASTLGTCWKQKRPNPTLTWWAYIIVGLAIAITSSIAHSKGAFVADSSQVVVIMCGFLPFGLVYRHAFLAVAIIAGFSLLVMAFAPGGREPLRQLQLALMIVVAVPAAAIGGYFRERAERRQFVLSLLLHKLACTDVLTGLPNRRRFLEHLETALSYAAREKILVGVGIGDIDFFKQYNDTYGHPAGDRLITAVGEAFRRTTRRPFDMIARYGGEEFAFLYFDVDQAGLHQRCLAALQNVRDLKAEHRATLKGFVTASLGYAHVVGREAGDVAMARADKALYIAKEGGRDHVVGSDPDEITLTDNV